MSRTSQRRTRTSRRLIAPLCLSLAALLCFVAEAGACRWDYLIWIQKSKDADPLYRFVNGEHKAGYIDRTGKIVIEPKFAVYGNYGDEFRDGLLDLSINAGRYVDRTGKEGKPEPYGGGQFAEGLAAVSDDETHLWGYVNRAGEFVISPRFEGNSALPFSEGLAWIISSGRYGLIDRSGRFIVDPLFLHGDSFSDGMARVVVEGPCTFYDGGPCPGSTVLGGGPLGAPACKFSFVDARGTVLEARFDSAGDFSEGLAPVRKGGKWGYIDKPGRVRIEPRFDYAESFSEGRGLVREGGLYGFIDERGKYVVPPSFDYAESFSDGLAPVGTLYLKEPRGMYYIDRSGRVAIPGPFLVASRFFKGLAHVEYEQVKWEKDGNEWRTLRFAYIDAKGKTVFSYQYDDEF